MKVLKFSALICYSLVCLPELAAADNHPGFSTGTTPELCNGYSEHSKQAFWGVVGSTETNCPKNYYAVGAQPGGTRAILGKKPADIYITIDCCKLPAADIIQDSHVTTTDKCPANHIVTGTDARFKKNKKPVDLKYELTCTQINTKRYQLGTTTEGISWGNSASSWQEDRRIRKRDVPAAIRYSLGRIDRYNWSKEGCLGYPFGSLLVGKQSKRCSGMAFQQLQYTGLEGDPPRGTPVEMYPKCSRIIGKNTPGAKCIP